MSGPGDGPVPYRVSYSARVRERLVELAAVARARGDGEAFVAALREFDHRLRVYPQFGDPLIDLLAEAGQVRLGAVPPLAMRYGVLEDRRQVLVAAPCRYSCPSGAASKGTPNQALHRTRRRGGRHQTPRPQ